MDDGVGAVLERSLQVRGREGVVDDTPRAVLMRDRGHRLDVDASQQRVRRRLEPHEHRIVRPRRIEREWIGEVDRAPRDADGFVHLRDEPIGAAVRVVAEEDALPRAHEGAEEGVLGREAAREREAVLGPFERREAGLERGARRVARARVLVPEVLTDGRLRERRRQRDRRDDRAAGGVGLLAGMDRAGLEAEPVLLELTHPGPPPGRGR